MKKATIELIKSSDVVTLYSISFSEERITEFELFVEKFESDAGYNRDYQRIIAALNSILRVGALERFFRPEGKYNDSLGAIPITGGALRLYCLRISDEVVILGNGGIKKSRSYEEDPLLYGYVLDLQKFEKLLRKMLNEGLIVLEKKQLMGVEDIEFKI